MYVIKAYGVDHKEHRHACPTVSSLLDAHPQIISAAFSYLAPGKIVPQHRGPFRGILRYHLILSMPRNAENTPAAPLIIAEEPYYLGSGDDLLWDDTYPHAVWNDSHAIRTALLLDVLRKDQPWGLALLSRCIVCGVGWYLRLRRSETT
jgi:aspartate beta-hydroxylase